MPVVDPAVDRLAVGVLGHEVGVAVGLHQLGDLVDRLVPGDALPLARRRARGISGYFSRFGLCTKSSRPAPLGHSVPRFTGWSGSPSMWMISETTFFALSPRLYMMMPQPTEQYGQVLRVSVVRASLKLRVSASTGCGEKPSSDEARCRQSRARRP